MKPPTDRPVESVRYFPSGPLEFEARCGCRARLGVEHQARGLARAGGEHDVRRADVISGPSAVLTYDTPVARPLASVSTSRAIAPVTIFSLPVAMAGGRNTDVDEKFECVAQPRPHCPQ